MDKFKIEKGIPIPPMANGGNGFSEVLRKLKKGDSVYLPTTVHKISSTAHGIFGKGNYATRTEGDGTRVWRTK